MTKFNTVFQILAIGIMHLLLFACNGSGNGTPDSELQHVYQVTAIRLNVLESLPLQLNIQAEGNTRTGGWSNPQLIPYIYVAPPADGIYEFDFKAQAPGGVVTQAITPINASYIMDPLPDNLKGVKIYAEKNNKVAMLEPQPGSIAYFEFKGSDETDRFVIKLLEQEKIKHARDLLAGNTKERPSVMGIIVKQKKTYNPGWSYHLQPKSISFFDTATEVCDANMRYVEEHLDEVGDAFLPGNRWCPWSSQLTKELDLK